MTLSEVFYEAACRMSDGEKSRYYKCGHSCCLVCDVGGNTFKDVYFDLIGRPVISQVEYAARSIGWSNRAFRTFMLLMASEAVK